MNPENVSVSLEQQLGNKPYLLQLLVEIPKINIDKKHDWAINKENIIIEFPDTQYSNFNLKWIEIVQRIDNVNDLIKSLFNDYVTINLDLDIDPIKDSIIKTPLYYKQKFVTEQIFYWIRKTVDEFISLIYVLEHLKSNNNEFPEKIRIDCIGSLISKNNKDFLIVIKNNRLDILTIINDISNTYKHSFLNSEIHANIGEKDPLVFAYGLERNDFDRKTVFVNYKIADVINSLNCLLEDLIEYIKQI